MIRRHLLDPVAEIMPARCTPEYERIVAKMGTLLPYHRARTLLAEFLPLGDVPAAETTRRGVGALPTLRTKFLNPALATR